MTSPPHPGRPFCWASMPSSMAGRPSPCPCGRWRRPAEVPAFRAPPPGAIWLEAPAIESAMATWPRSLGHRCRASSSTRCTHRRRAPSPPYGCASPPPSRSPPALARARPSRWPLPAPSASTWAPRPARISALVYAVERIHHGTPSGIDNTVVAYGQPVYFCRRQPPAPPGRRSALPPAGRQRRAVSTSVAVGSVRERLEPIPGPTKRALASIGASRR